MQEYPTLEVAYKQKE